MTFSTIIVGVDGREGGRDALALAEVMRDASGELIAVQAYPYEYLVSRGSNADFGALMRDEMQEKLRPSSSGTASTRKPSSSPTDRPPGPCTSRPSATAPA